MSTFYIRYIACTALEKLPTEPFNYYIQNRFLESDCDIFSWKISKSFCCSPLNLQLSVFSLTNIEKVLQLSHFVLQLPKVYRQTILKYHFITLGFFGNFIWRNDKTEWYLWHYVLIQVVPYDTVCKGFLSITHTFCWVKTMRTLTPI